MAGRIHLESLCTRLTQLVITTCITKCIPVTLLIAIVHFHICKHVLFSCIFQLLHQCPGMVYKLMQIRGPEKVTFIVVLIKGTHFRLEIWICQK